jgi:ADP-ribose pyrophosphatase
LLEVPAGKVEPGEPLHAAAARELSEETGYRAARLERVLSFYTSPGILDEEMHLFVAEELTEGETQLEDDEEIARCVVRADEAVAMATRGDIRDGKTLVALLWYATARRGRAGVL